MQKIMFNDKYGLTDAVVESKKTMTRREPIFDEVREPDIRLIKDGKNKGKLALCDGTRIIHTSHYRILEVVAIAQPYKDIPVDCVPYGDGSYCLIKSHKGFTNKMFVKPEIMPHQIRIIDIKVERLQNISNEDCLAEGVYKDKDNGRFIGHPFRLHFDYTFYGARNKEGKQLHWTTPREAFAELIDKVSGQGTWDKNPYVFAYEFQLFK